MEHIKYQNHNTIKSKNNTTLSLLKAVSLSVGMILSGEHTQAMTSDRMYEELETFHIQYKSGLSVALEQKSFGIDNQKEIQYHEQKIIEMSRGLLKARNVLSFEYPLNKISKKDLGELKNSIVYLIRLRYGEEMIQYISDDRDYPNKYISFGFIKIMEGEYILQDIFVETKKSEK